MAKKKPTRDRPGQPKKFPTPEYLEQAWVKFKNDIKEQSKDWLKVQYVGKDGERVVDGQKVPLTLEGFKRFCRNHYGEVEQYFSNQDQAYGEFLGICARIRQEIREDQIIGGLLGFYNPSITQRLNGLKEEQEITVNSVKILNIDPLSEK